MQVSLTPSSAAEARLLAAFINDLADLMDLGTPAVVAAPTPPEQVAARVTEAVTPPAAPSRKPRAKKTDPDASESATEKKAETGEAPTLDAPAPAESAEAGESPEAPAKEVSLDDLRVLFGSLTQEGKRPAAVEVVRSYGANGLSEIKEEQRAEVFAKLKGL